MTRQVRLFLLMVCCCGISFLAAANDYYRAYISRYWQVAVLHQQKYAIPASITLAQGLLESGAGRSFLATKGNNHFGIKCHSSWEGDRLYKDDDAKNECYRSYHSAEESFEDHALFLKRKRYKPLFELRTDDYKSWAKTLKKCGYATDPKYPEKLISLIERYELWRFDNGQPPLGELTGTENFETPEQGFKSEVAVETQNFHTIHLKNGLRCITVRHGDTLKAIAKEYGIKEGKLRKYNDLKKNRPLTKGELVYLQEKHKKYPGPEYFHNVLPGETLHSVAQRYGIRLKELAKINRIKRDAAIEPGMSLKLRKD